MLPTFCWILLVGRFSFGKEIVDLPGLSFTPNFRHYSGYLQASATRFLHYWFVESQGEPVNDPLIIWFNGGPGCSSLTGLLHEMGPYLVKEDGKTLERNPDSWNRFANILYLDAPAGTGFSHATDGNLCNSDEQTTVETYEAIKQFFEEFPNYRHHETFIMGESYGGILVPLLAERIIECQKDFPINFKGIAIGNGLLNVPLLRKTQRQFAYTRGFYDESGWAEFVKKCCGGCASNCPEGDLSNYCEEILSKADVARGINRYDVYGECAASNKSVAGFETLPTNDDDDNLAPRCANVTAILNYLRAQTVRQALFIPPNVKNWTVCSARSWAPGLDLSAVQKLKAPKEKPDETAYTIQQFLLDKAI